MSLNVFILVVLPNSGIKTVPETLIYLRQRNTGDFLRVGKQHGAGQRASLHERGETRMRVAVLQSTPPAMTD